MTALACCRICVAYIATKKHKYLSNPRMHMSELGRGRCDFQGRCHCAFGFMMPDCAERQQCDQECFAHGRCRDNECICNQGWFGTNCISDDEHSLQKFVPRIHGREHRLDCYAPADLKAGRLLPCSGKGICITERGCVCDPLVYGKQCQYSVCPGVQHCNKECCGNGKCDPTVSDQLSDEAHKIQCGGVD